MTAPGSSPPIPIDWRNLIQAGRDLLNPQQVGNTPTREHVRRAISNAYYALFHVLAENNAAALVGTPSDAATTAAWSRVYRGLDHSRAHRELQRHQPEFSVQAQGFAKTFSDMQRFRHLADYDHTASFTAHEAMAYLDRVETAILDYTQVATSERVYIATLTLIRPR